MNNWLYVSAYVNANYEIHKLGKAKDWPWSSYPEYKGTKRHSMSLKDIECLGPEVNKEIILKQFENINSYNEFTNRVISNSIEVKDTIKECLIE